MKLYPVNSDLEEDPWTDETNSGYEDDDVIITASKFGHLHDVTTIITTDGPGGSLPETDIQIGLVTERVYAFVGVLAVLILLAVSICVYIRFFHGRKESHTITPIKSTPNQADQR